MKTALILLTLLCLPAVALRAADPIPSVPIKASDAVQLATAISLLDSGFQLEVKQGSEASKVITSYYEFGGETRMALARDLTLLKAAAEDLEAVRKAAQREGGLDDCPPAQDVAAYAAYVKAHPAQVSDFSKKMDAARAVILPLALVKIEVADLRLEHNQIPLQLLSALSPIIK